MRAMKKVVLRVDTVGVLSPAHLLNEQIHIASGSDSIVSQRSLLSSSLI
jgi:hypothetical protein